MLGHTATLQDRSAEIKDEIKEEVKDETAQSTSGNGLFRKRKLKAGNVLKH